MLLNAHWHFSCSILSENKAKVREETADVHGCGYVSTLQGVLSTIVREYHHCDGARLVS